MRAFFLLALLLPLSAQPAAQTKVELLADHSVVTPGQQLQIGLRLVSPPHWHTYWKNPGDAGSPTEITWEKQSRATVGDWQWPAPRLFRQDTIYNFVYEGDTLIPIPLTISSAATPGEKITLRGNAAWLECDDSSCHPQEAPVSLTLTVGEKPIPAHTDRFAKARAALPVDSAAWKLSSARQGDTLSLRLTPTSAEANTAVSGIRFFPADEQVPASAEPQITTEGATRVLTFNIANAYKKDGSALAGVLTATNSWLTNNPAATALAVSVPFSSAPLSSAAVTPATPAVAEEKPADTPEWGEWSLAKQEQLLAGGKLLYIDFTARWCATCQVNKRVYSDPQLAAAFRQNNVVTLKADWTKKNPEIAAELAKYQRAAVPFNVFLQRDRPPVILPELLTVGNVLAHLDVALGQAEAAPVEKPADTAFPVQIFFAFVGGLILNLMPCVFPVLGLKIMNFVGQAGENRRKIVLHGLVFTGGVLLSFWALAGVLMLLRSRGANLGWGFQLQEPGFVIAMAVLLLVFALNMAGVFEIGGKAVGIGSNLTAKSGLQGSFFSGVLATVIATPCAAPFLAPALGAALTLPLGSSFLLFTAIALGLSLPYLLLSAFPSLINLLPRPGPWMESFKQGLSFLLFATVLYLLWVLAAQVDAGSLQIFLGMAVIAFACWIYGRWGAPWRTAKVRATGTGLAALLFLGTCFYYYTLLRQD